MPQDFSESVLPSFDQIYWQFVILMKNLNLSWVEFLELETLSREWLLDLICYSTDMLVLKTQ